MRAPLKGIHRKCTGTPQSKTTDLRFAYHRREPSGLHDKPNAWASVLHVLLRGLGLARSCMHVPGRGQCVHAAALAMAHEMASNSARLHSCCTHESPYLTIRVQPGAGAPITDVEVSTPFVET